MKGISHRQHGSKYRSSSFPRSFWAAWQVIDFYLKSLEIMHIATLVKKGRIPKFDLCF